MYINNTSLLKEPEFHRLFNDEGQLSDCQQGVQIRSLYTYIYIHIYIYIYIYIYSLLYSLYIQTIYRLYIYIIKKT